MKIEHILKYEGKLCNEECTHTTLKALTMKCYYFIAATFNYYKSKALICKES